MTKSRRLRHPHQILVIEVPNKPREDEIRHMVRDMLRSKTSGIVVATGGIRIHCVPWGAAVDIEGRR